MTRTEPDRELLRATLDIWHPECWGICSTAETGSSLVGHGAAVSGDSAYERCTIYGGSVAFGTRKAFAIGALVLGFATLGWSGSILAGRSVENLQRRLNTASDWTEADSRRAMARILGFGTGMVLGVGLVDALL